MESETDKPGLYLLSFVATRGNVNNIEPCLYFCDSADRAKYEAFKAATEKYPDHTIQVGKAHLVKEEFIASAYDRLFPGR